MKIFCKELNKSFENKEDMFKALIENEKSIIDRKKSHIYNSEEWISKNGLKGLQIVSDQKSLDKTFIDAEKKIKIDSNYYYFVINSANYLDSHEDVHLDGNWNKTVKDKQGKVYFVWHHEFENPENILSFPEDVEMFTAKVSWSLLGKDYNGETYCLVFKISKDKIQSEKVIKWLEQNRKLQLSPRMRYVEILFCVNSENPEYAKQKKNYDDIFPLIVNKDEFVDEIDYFFGIKQSEIVMEASLLPFGSNSATAEIGKYQSENKEIEAVDNTSKEEPLEDTQNQSTVEVQEKRKSNLFIKI